LNDSWVLDIVFFLISLVAKISNILEDNFRIDKDFGFRIDKELGIQFRLLFVM
jgi:hypothetical protein